MKSLYKNLLKSSWVTVQENEVRVIESNERLEKKIKELRRNMAKESLFTEGLAVQESGEGEMPVEAIIKAEPAYVGPSQEELMAQAQEEIEGMLAQARGEAEALKKEAYENGRQEGFMTGQQESARQAEMQNRKLQERERELESFYQSRIEEVEPMLIETLTGIYEHIFHVKLECFRDTIIHLAGGAIGQSESNKDFIVRVSKADYKCVTEGKEQLENMTTANSTVEIVEDVTLAEGECLIETGGGIFDCGLGTELSELAKELKLLSYES